MTAAQLRSLTATGPILATSPVRFVVQTEDGTEVELESTGARVSGVDHDPETGIAKVRLGELPTLVLVLRQP